MSWVDPAPHRLGRICRDRVEGNLWARSQSVNEIDDLFEDKQNVCVEDEGQRSDLVAGNQ